MWWVFPKGALSHWVQWVRFALQKLSVTWQSRGIFLCIPFLAIVVRSVTTDSDAFLFSKKVISECLRATQWKFDYSPSEKQLLKYWLLDGFTIVSFCFWKDTSAASAICSCFCFCCWGFGACPEQGHKVGIYHGSEKVPFVYPCLFLFKPLISFPPFEEIAPRLSLLSQSLSKAKT